MLQPRSYPDLIGKALFLEPDPYLVMAHDDEPLAEGALLVVLVGLLTGAATVAGNVLRGIATTGDVGDNPFVVQGASVGAEEIALWMADPVRYVMLSWHAALGLDSGWGQSLLLLVAPLLAILLWLVAGIVLWGTGRLMGGEGTLTQVLGASALVTAPMLFYLVHLAPFTYVNLLLPLVWALLMYYRAAQMSHDIPWTRALGVTCISVLLLAMGWITFGASALLLTLL